MTNKFGIRSTVVAVLLGAWGASGIALAQTTEVEPNNPIISAQPLVVDSTGSVTVTGVIGTLTGNPNSDVDYYTFQAKAGDVVTIDIDGTSGLDSYLTLFGPGPNFGVLAADDDVGNPPDPGSENHPQDALIASYGPLLADGTYTVGVSGYPLTFIDGGAVINLFGLAMDSTSYGSYTLIISGVTPPAPQPPVVQPPAPQPVVQQVSIEIRPGVRTLSTINPKAKGVIPVVLLSSADFDALQVDQSSLTFGATGDEQSLVRCNEHGVDINHDKHRDLLCLFDNQAAGFQPDDLMGTIKGKTMAGQPFEGKGFLKVLHIHRRDLERGHFDRDQHSDRGRHGDRDAD